MAAVAVGCSTRQTHPNQDPSLAIVVTLALRILAPNKINGVPIEDDAKNSYALLQARSAFLLYTSLIWRSLSSPLCVKQCQNKFCGPIFLRGVFGGVLEGRVVFGEVVFSSRDCLRLSVTTK